MKIQTQPNSKETEKWVLWAILIDKEAFIQVREILKKEDFYNISNGLIWETMAKLNESKTPIDLLTISDELEKNKVLEDIWWISYLANLSTEVPTSSHILTYAKIVKDLSIKRQIIKVWNEIMGLWYSENKENDILISEIKTKLLEITTWASNFKPKSWNDLKSIMHKELARKREFEKSWKDLILQSHWLAFERWSHTVIWALSSHWKSMFMLALLLDFAKQGYKVLYINIEMTDKQIMDRIYAHLTWVDSTVFKYMNTENILELIEKWEKEFTKIQDNFFMLTKWTISSWEISSICSDMVIEHWIEVHWVDYIWIITEQWFLNKSQEIWKISSTLRWITKDYQTIWITAGQFSKQWENEIKPSFKYIKDSSEIKNDADTALVLFRCQDNVTMPWEPTHEVIIEKNRTGQLWTLNFILDPKISKFTQI